ncbi:MAG TPA: DUF1702 family protein [Myxococcales bacterium]
MSRDLHRSRAAALLLLASLGCAHAVRRSADPEVEKAVAEAARLYGGGRGPDALTLLEGAMARRPDSLELGNVYRRYTRQLNLEERSISFLRNLSTAPNAPDEAFFNLAFAYIDKIPRVGPMGAGFLSKRSIASFRAVLDREPDNWIATYGIGMNYLHWPEYFKKTEEVTTYFQRCLALQAKREQRPADILTYLRLGDAFAKKNQVDEARKVWTAGLEKFPGHKDLLERLALEPGKVTAAIQQHYNPNASIGAIDTDVSILWAETVPEHAQPLHTAAPATMAAKVKDDSRIGLFSWFVHNLPFLADSRQYARVDMSVLGVRPGDALANQIAHQMIRGFSQIMEDRKPEEIEQAAEGTDSFGRPFFHEGVGMAMAASLDTSDPDSFRSFAERVKVLDPNFRRLHVAGAGMWFGVQGTPPATAFRTFESLEAAGSAYAFEGYGFAQVLFHSHGDATQLELGGSLPPIAAASFYHGAGRALWILGNGGPQALSAHVSEVPEKFRHDLYSGYAMGVAFTMVSDPARIVSAWKDAIASGMTAADVESGGVMGLVIREIADPAYMRERRSFAQAHGVCFLDLASEIGKGALDDVTQGGGEFHSNWRARIRERLAAYGDLTERKCG